MNNLREVLFQDPRDTQSEDRKEKTGYFHMFTGEYMSETVAIIETEEGECLQVPLNQMRFKASPK